jgi:hypothetical protein
LHRNALVNAVEPVGILGANRDWREAIDIIRKFIVVRATVVAIDKMGATMTLG